MSSIAPPLAVHDPLRSMPVLTAEKETPNSMSLKSETASSAEEKAYPWEGFEEEDIPDKTQGRILRNLRFQIFSIYRRIFGVVFATNMSVFIWFVCRGTNALELGEVVIANLFASILMRQDYVINAWFTIFTSVPTSFPLWIRTLCARVYSIGGIHSGCAVSGTVWLILFAAQATKEFVDSRKISIATLVVTYCILCLLLIMIALAYPAFRAVRHDAFEQVHRFLGWTATGLVWSQVILLINDYKDPEISLPKAMRQAVPFWLVVVLTASIILPWVRLRKLSVRSEVLSNHALRIYFDYATPVPGSFVRISEDPLTEWHSFATIAEPGKKGFSMIISRAGDWTSKLIAEPPKEIWVRGIPTRGVVNILPLFRRVLIVATGSGIAPLCPVIFQKRIQIRLLWTSPNVRKTFGDGLVDAILDACPDTVLYDTRVHGKPDMVKLTYRMVRDYKPEAVCIISNVTLTKKVVYGLMSRGIPTFGAIWDS